ncbi:endo-alpha-N-acetylgalactosaminidase family protein [Amycolatopsis sp. NPDC058986]|uniref:endo-alpha-N-acetylgalactosaminidase family protein n=1 Tax=unclassified Amycolatopsis TaxID=2618356 RepID=UPI00366CD11A
MRRLACLAALCAVAAGGVAAPAAADDQLVTLRSANLKVTVDPKFPRVVEYTDARSGAKLYGNEDKIGKVVLNGTAYTPQVTSRRAGDHVGYRLGFPEYGGVVLDATIGLEGSEIDFKITRIQDTEKNPVKSLSIPDQNLVSVRSDQPGAALAAAKMYNATTGTGDTFTQVTKDAPAEAAPSGAMYGIVNTGQLAASIETNSAYDTPSGPTAKDNGRIRKQIADKGAYKRAGLWSGDWTYRANGASRTDTEPLPYTKIVVTGDRNGDKAVDWQDGAIAFRDIMTNPRGWQQVAQRPIMRIPFNFASNAEHPFTQSLDETKRVALNTDGLGQFVLLKGYGSEGHDSAHPDYAGVGKRQGGVKDLNALVENSRRYNADIGVHIQDTEEYPVSPAFDPAIANDVKKDLGWDWLDQSYHINYRYDGQSGKRLSRLEAFKKEVPGLDFLYVDTWYGDGYTSEKFAREMNGLGYDVATEFPDKFERQSVWSHWANDVHYGGSNYKGINSQIVRFIRNHQKDDWIAGDPLLGGGELSAYEGWVGGAGYPAFIAKTFGTDLPTKYLQGFTIQKWAPHTIALSDGVSVSDSTGTRQISKDGHLVLNGGAYLLPWSQQEETKLYHWNPAGGSTKWTLPKSWGAKRSVKLYQLTDTGRRFVKDLNVDATRQISIDAVAKTPYVVYPADPGPNADANWGDNTGLKDPSFYSGNLDAWKVTGDKNKASVPANAAGQRQLRIDGGQGTTVSQQVAGLTGGKTYTASVNVQVAPGQRKASLTVSPAGGKRVAQWTDASTVKNYVRASEYAGTATQRMKVVFDVPSGQSTATLALEAAAGNPAVSFDDVRVVQTGRTPQGGHYFAEDFEHVDTGWGPFVYAGNDGAPDDPRTHIAQKNAPYTQAGWNGKLVDDVIGDGESLKSHEENQGLVYRTLPQTLRFEPGHRYRVSFTYEASKTGDYAFVTGAGTSTTFAEAHTPTTFTATVDGGADAWIGVAKLTPGTQNQDHDLILDNLVVDEIG